MTRAQTNCRFAEGLLCLLSLLAVLLLLAPPAQAQRGALVLQQDLAELVAQSATIVRGHVISARVEPHPQFQNLDTVVVTLRVAEVLKGQAGSTYTYRQYIWDIRDRFDAAGYRKGQHLLLLMTKPSRYGLSSPVGLAQGRFRIIVDREGELYAVNGAGNHGLLRNLSTRLAKRPGKRARPLSPRLQQIVLQRRGGPLLLSDLEELIRALPGTGPETRR